MTEKEQIEVWRKQFESQFDDKLFHRGIDGEYINNHRQSLWIGFCMAKRTMPVIELPKLTERHSANYIDGVQDCKAAITDAGYKYKIKGE